MNAQNAHEYLPLVQAVADGKTIQIRNTSGEWEDLSNFCAVYEPDEYRIKPEPRTFDVWVCIDPYYDWAEGDKRLDEPRVEYIKRWERITVQEVLK